MSNTVVGLFDDANDAHGAVQDLMAAGYTKDRISLVATDPNGEYQKYAVDAGGNLSGEGAASGLVYGTLTGGLIGLLIGAGAILVGPAVLVAGPFAGLIAGAAAGAATGGFLGGLIGMGIPKEHAEYYAEGIRRGGTLVTITVEEGETERVRDLLDRDGAVDIEQRADYYRNTGYQSYDKEAHPLTTEERERERDLLKAYASTESTATGIGAAVKTGRIKTYAYADTPTTLPINPPDDSNGTA